MCVTVSHVCVTYLFQHTVTDMCVTVSHVCVTYLFQHTVTDMRHMSSNTSHMSVCSDRHVCQSHMSATDLSLPTHSHRHVSVSPTRHSHTSTTDMSHMSVALQYLSNDTHLFQHTVTAISLSRHSHSLAKHSHAHNCRDMSVAGAIVTNETYLLQDTVTHTFCSRHSHRHSFCKTQSQSCEVPLARKQGEYVSKIRHLSVSQDTVTVCLQDTVTVSRSETPQPPAKHHSHSLWSMSGRSRVCLEQDISLFCKTQAQSCQVPLARKQGEYASNKTSLCFAKHCHSVSSRHSHSLAKDLLRKTSCEKASERASAFSQEVFRKRSFASL